MNQETLTAIDESTEHWKEIVNILETTKGKVCNRVGVSFMVGKHIIEYDCLHCALCQVFRCQDCPIKSCSHGSTWSEFHYATSKKDRIKHAKQMVQDLINCK